MTDNAEIQRRSDSVARSMLRAGIGKVFHSRKLSEFGDAGTLLKNRVDDVRGIRSFIGSGRGFSIECKKHSSFDIAYVLARGLRLSRVEVIVAGLIDLQKYVQNQNGDWTGTRFEEFDAAEALVIPRFFEPTFQPFAAKELQFIEYYLMQRMADGFSVSIQYQGDMRASGLWSPYFLDWLAEKNERVVL